MKLRKDFRLKDIFLLFQIAQNLQLKLNSSFFTGHLFRCSEHRPSRDRYCFEKRELLVNCLINWKKGKRIDSQAASKDALGPMRVVKYEHGLAYLKTAKLSQLFSRVSSKKNQHLHHVINRFNQLTFLWSMHLHSISIKYRVASLVLMVRHFGEGLSRLNQSTCAAIFFVVLQNITNIFVRTMFFARIFCRISFLEIFSGRSFYLTKINGLKTTKMYKR